MLIISHAWQPQVYINSIRIRTRLVYIKNNIDVCQMEIIPCVHRYIGVIILIYPPTFQKVAAHWRTFLNINRFALTYTSEDFFIFTLNVCFINSINVH